MTMTPDHSSSLYSWLRTSLVLLVNDRRQSVQADSSRFDKCRQHSDVFFEAALALTCDLVRASHVRVAGSR